MGLAWVVGGVGGAGRVFTTQPRIWGSGGFRSSGPGKGGGDGPTGHLWAVTVHIWLGRRLEEPGLRVVGAGRGGKARLRRS